MWLNSGWVGLNTTIRHMYGRSGKHCWGWWVKWWWYVSVLKYDQWMQELHAFFNDNKSWNLAGRWWAQTKITPTLTIMDSPMLQLNLRLGTNTEENQSMARFKIRQSHLLYVRTSWYDKVTPTTLETWFVWKQQHTYLVAGGCRWTGRRIWQVLKNGLLPFSQPHPFFNHYFLRPDQSVIFSQLIHNNSLQCSLVFLLVTLTTTHNTLATHLAQE